MKNSRLTFLCYRYWLVCNEQRTTCTLRQQLPVSEGSVSWETISWCLRFLMWTLSLQCDLNNVLTKTAVKVFINGWIARGRFLYPEKILKLPGNLEKLPSAKSLPRIWIVNTFATGNTPVCGGRFEHVDNITVHIIQMKQSPVYKELIIFLMANNTMRCN